MDAWGETYCVIRTNEYVATASFMWDAGVRTYVGHERGREGVICSHAALTIGGRFSEACT
jgi:hypothetical protein